MIDANKMRVLTKQATQDIEALEKLREAKASEAVERWWRRQGYPALLESIEACGREGKHFYKGVSDEKPPEFVLENLKALGFEVSVEITPAPKPISYVLKVSW